jgi:glutamine synthetase adenylyltransferase
MYVDEQVHRLPREREAEEALCSAMEVADWPTLSARLWDMRERVHRIFTEVFAPGAESAPPDAIERSMALLWNEHPDAEAAQLSLREAHYVHGPEQVVQAVQSVRSRVRHSVSEATQRRMGQLL